MDYDLPDTEDLMHALSKHAVALARKGWYEMATDVDTAATKLRILQEDVEDLEAQLAELTAENDRLREDRDYMREEFYIMQDRFEDERAEADRLRDEANEAQLRLDEARQIESDLRSEIVSLQETIDMQQEYL